ncbi:Sodium/hydrogen exchanger 1, partial [Ophiophagus hannah]
MPGDGEAPLLLPRVTFPLRRSCPAGAAAGASELRLGDHSAAQLGDRGHHRLSIPASPPVPAEIPPDTGHPKNVSTNGHGKHRKVFPVLALQYKEVHVPFEITLWILLACLMKLDWTVIN